MSDHRATGRRAAEPRAADPRATELERAVAERAAETIRAARTGATDAERAAATAGTPTAADRAAYVETAIQQAIRAGAFDDLPGAGRPLQLEPTHDPDWWIRRKIQSEQLRGLGPPALTLRVEAAQLEETLDALARETDVREHLDEFNRRVVEARRQLLGGPPVVTAIRDIDADVERWRQRRASTQPPDADTQPARRRWWRRG